MFRNIFVICTLMDQDGISSEHFAHITYRQRQNNKENHKFILPYVCVL